MAPKKIARTNFAKKDSAGTSEKEKNAVGEEEAKEADDDVVIVDKRETDNQLTKSPPVDERNKRSLRINPKKRVPYVFKVKSPAGTKLWPKSTQPVTLVARADNDNTPISFGVLQTDVPPKLVPQLVSTDVPASPSSETGLPSKAPILPAEKVPINKAPGKTPVKTEAPRRRLTATEIAEMYEEWAQPIRWGNFGKNLGPRKFRIDVGVQTDADSSLSDIKYSFRLSQHLTLTILEIRSQTKPNIVYQYARSAKRGPVDEPRDYFACVSCTKTKKSPRSRVMLVPGRGLCLSMKQKERNKWMEGYIDGSHCCQGIPLATAIGKQVLRETCQLAMTDTRSGKILHDLAVEDLRKRCLAEGVSFELALDALGKEYKDHERTLRRRKTLGGITTEHSAEDRKNRKSNARTRDDVKKCILHLSEVGVRDAQICRSLKFLFDTMGTPDVEQYLPTDKTVRRIIQKDKEEQFGPEAIPVNEEEEVIVYDDEDAIAARTIAALKRPSTSTVHVVRGRGPEIRSPKIENMPVEYEDEEMEYDDADDHETYYTYADQRPWAPQAGPSATYTYHYIE